MIITALKEQYMTVVDTLLLSRKLVNYAKNSIRFLDSRAVFLCLPSSRKLRTIRTNALGSIIFKRLYKCSDWSRRRRRVCPYFRRPEPRMLTIWGGIEDSRVMKRQKEWTRQVDRKAKLTKSETLGATESRQPQYQCSAQEHEVNLSSRYKSTRFAAKQRQADVRN